MVSDQDESGKSFLRFRLPVQLLKEEVPSIGEFPYTPPPPVSATSPQWMGPVLVLKGAQSKYVNRRNIPICEAFFPNCRVEILDAGHWVHAEKPAETVELVGQFILDGK
jgi:pimeloyl-ACP methyl ester carboxylesterase